MLLKSTDLLLILDIHGLVAICRKYSQQELQFLRLAGAANWSSDKKRHTICHQLTFSYAR